MKQKIIILIILIFVFFIIFLLILKMNIPFNYKETEILSEAQKYVIDLQNQAKLEPYEVAEKYLYYKTDYHDKIPKRIKVTTKIVNKNNFIVIIYDPSCEDDSEFEMIDRIYLIEERNIWKPIKHDWSHKGRGRFGWTTQPTF